MCERAYDKTVNEPFGVCVCAAGKIKKKCVRQSVDRGSAVEGLCVPIWRRFWVIFSKVAHQTSRG